MFRKTALIGFAGLVQNPQPLILCTSVVLEEVHPMVIWTGVSIALAIEV